MKYALIIAGYALILWGIYTIRRESQGGRATSYREGQAEVEAVVEEFVAAAERVRSDLERKSAELQRMINLADDRLAKLIQAQSVAPQAPAHSTAPPSPAPTAATGELTTAPATNLPARGRAAAAASYKAQAADADGSNANASQGAQEAKSVRATLTGQDEDTDPADQARERGEAGEKKSRRDRSRHAEVYRLADSGQPVVEIARLTGLSKGEVQLILDLRKTR